MGPCRAPQRRVPHVARAAGSRATRRGRHVCPYTKEFCVAALAPRMPPRRALFIGQHRTPPPPGALSATVRPLATGADRARRGEASSQRARSLPRSPAHAQEQARARACISHALCTCMPAGLARLACPLYPRAPGAAGCPPRQHHKHGAATPPQARVGLGELASNTLETPAPVVGALRGGGGESRTPCARARPLLKTAARATQFSQRPVCRFRPAWRAHLGTGHAGSPQQTWRTQPAERA